MPGVALAPPGFRSWLPWRDMGLAFYFDLDHASVSGGVVDSLTDRTSNGVTCTAAGGNRLVFNATDANAGGRASMTGATNSKRMDLGAAKTLHWSFVVAHHPLTLFAGADTLFSDASAAATQLSGAAATANWTTAGAAIAGTRKRNGVTTTTALGTANQLFLYEFLATSPASRVLRVGNYSTASFGWTGNILAFGGCETAPPSAGNVTRLRAFLSSYYGQSL